tara:strand:+ start:48 stop:470 length:423 start_codon:yes stop_codon:yes gene_type:complete
MYKLIILLTLLTSCGDLDLMFNEPHVNEEHGFLELYMNTNQDENGYYLVDYPDWEDNSYTAVYYKTSPYTRVFWTSTDSFTVYHWGEAITEPIINYSTYSSSDSTGQQMIYLYQDFIYDTLTIVGYIDENVVSTLNFIVY